MTDLLKNNPENIVNNFFKFLFKDDFSIDWFRKEKLG
jgi:hypothetical protein